ncbi:TPA: hemagglutinin repeat-containing protein [Burkholderia vietnamiensis]|nr:hemagglutinin repeat-containing protein [Burkholderia vietnamiensis]
MSIGFREPNGIAFTASMACNQRSRQWQSTTWSNTHVTAGDTLAIELGADMNLNGRLRPASDGLKGLTSRTQLEMINQHISILRIRPRR